MFRPDRIGTPVFHDQDFLSSVIDFSFGAATKEQLLTYFQCINVGLPNTYGRTALNWTGSESVAANAKVGFGYQFTVTEPLGGRANGVLVECNGAFMLPVSSRALIQPFFAKVGTAGATILEAVAVEGNITPMGEPLQALPDTAADIWRSVVYKQQVVIAQSAVAGVYAQGIQIFTGDDAWDCTALKAICSVRQFNDVQALNYQDPLR